MHTFTFDGRLDIDARLMAGLVRLQAAPAGTAEVELRADGSAGQALIDGSRVELEDRGGHPRLLVHVPRDGGRGRSWFTLRDPRVEVTIRCPAGSDLAARVASADLDAEVPLGTVTAHSASGDVTLVDVHGALDVATASGDVAAARVEQGATIRTAAGDARTSAVSGGLTVRTASGHVVAGRVEGPVRIRTVSGDTDLEEAHGPEVSVNATSGDVRLAIAADRGVHLDVATVSGTLTSELDEDDGSAGVDIQLRARTVSGDVHLRRTRTSAAPPA